MASVPSFDEMCEDTRNPCIIALQKVPANLWEDVGLPPLFSREERPEAFPRRIYNFSQEARDLRISDYMWRWQNHQQMQYEDHGYCEGYSPDQEQGPWMIYNDFIMKLIMRAQKYYRRGIRFVNCDPALLLAITWPVEYLLDINHGFVYPYPRAPLLREEDGNLTDIRERFMAEIADDETDSEGSRRDAADESSEDEDAGVCERCARVTEPSVNSEIMRQCTKCAVNLCTRCDDSASSELWLCKACDPTPLVIVTYKCDECEYVCGDEPCHGCRRI